MPAHRKSETTNHGRSSWACARCRRQKLRCDLSKPCTLCVRAGSDCTPQEVPAFKVKRVNDYDTRGLLKKRRATSDTLSTSRDGELLRDVYAAASPAPSENDTSLPTTATSPLGKQQFGANTSAMKFARNMFGDQDGYNDNLRASVPGHATPPIDQKPIHLPVTIPKPQREVFHAAIEAYFDRMHWFILILHKPSFVARAHTLLWKPQWLRRDLSDVLLIFMVSAIGLQCVRHDASWTGHGILASSTLQAGTLARNLVEEVRIRLGDLVEECKTETVQVYMLFGIFCIYHGSPLLAWNVSGLSARTAYALALHCDKSADSSDDIADQVGKRCWNHVVCGDTFASTIYGRPSSIDPAFSNLHTLLELDDTELPPTLRRLPLLQGPHGPISALTFHVLRYKLYEITKHTLETFRVLRLTDPISTDDLQSLAAAVRRIEGYLRQWRRELPPFFDPDRGNGLDPWSELLPNSPTYPEFEKDAREKLCMQATLLQVMYDSAVILAHRPLFEHKIGLTDGEERDTLAIGSVPGALPISVRAALRISKVPIARFEHHLAASFTMMQLFIAGVILCIPPTSQPFSQTAQEAKEGVLRIIQASRLVRATHQSAAHTEKLLSDLLRVTIQRETESALRLMDRDHEHPPPPHHSLPTPARDPISPPIPLLHAPPSHPLPLPSSSSSSSSDTTTVPTPTNTTTTTTSTSNATNITTIPSPLSFASESLHSYLTSNSVLYSGEFGLPMHQQLDEAFGAFGEMFFNLVPDDRYGSWGWGAS